MTKFYNNSKLVKETKHIFPEKVNLDAYHDLKTSNWHFLSSEEKIYDRRSGIHENEFVEMIFVKNSHTDPKIRALAMANIQNYTPWCQIRINEGPARHKIYVHDNILLPKDWWEPTFSSLKHDPWPKKIIAKDLPEAIVVKKLSDADEWCKPFNKTFAFNNERMYNTYIDQSKVPIDNFIGVASGFKSYMFLKNIGYTDETRVTLIDNNPGIVELKKWLHTEWDFSKEQYFNEIKKYDLVDQNREWLWDRDVEMFGGLEEMKESLQDIFKLNIKCEQDSITNLTRYTNAPPGKTVLWWNGVFKYPPSFYNKTQGDMNNWFDTFLEDVQSLGDNVLCYGNDPYTTSYNNITIKELVESRDK